MKMSEYEKVKNLTYLEYSTYLQQKYGIGRSDYMYKSYNRNHHISRTKEGLVVHHKFEDHAIMLCNPIWASRNPFEWQLAKNMVYCDLNCTPFVRQYGILFRKWGVFVCQRDNESTTERRR